MVEDIVPLYRDTDTLIDAWDAASDFVMKSLSNNPDKQTL